MQKQPKVKYTDDGVKIIQFHLLMTPTPMGQSQLVVYGLGDDNVIYQYDPATEKWFHLPV